MKLIITSSLICIAINLFSQKEVQTHIFGHSLINFVSEDYPNHHTATPYWVAQLADAADHSYEMSGQWGQLHEHRLLNVQPQWGLTDVDGAWDADFETFDQAELSSVIIMPSNFEQYISSTTNFDGQDYSAVDATQTVFNWCLDQQPDLQFYIYEHWPEMSSDLIADSTGWGAYNSIITGSYHNWFVNYQSAMIDSFPDACVSMIPVGPIISQIQLSPPFNELPLSEWYVDPDPHGTPNLYFLAGMISYMALYEEQAPSNYSVPEFIHSTIRDNYGNLITTIWSALKEYDSEGMNRSVFCNSTTTSTSDIVLETEAINFMPNPCDDILTIEGILNEFTIEIIDQNGQLHQTISTDEDSVSIDVSALPPGLFFLRINRADVNLDPWVETLIKMD